MAKLEKQKTDNLDWIKAILFPKKGKPVDPEPAWMPKKPSAQAVSQPQAPAAPKAVQAPAVQKQASQPIKWAMPGVQGKKLFPAFVHVTTIISFIVNIILIVALVIVARELFALKAIVNDYLLYGLYANFIKMDTAHIKTNIVVGDNIPVQFDLPISQQITVTLTQNTRISNASVGVLSVPTTVTLPAGTRLPIQLDLTVPVQTAIPIKLNVPVDIPLNQTELHEPFIGLQQVVSPFYKMIYPLKSPENIPGCGIFNVFCNWFFYR